MTMPHLMNCQHSEDGWCLDCVKESREKKQSEIKRLRAVILVAATEIDALGDTDLHQLASEIAEERGADEPSDDDLVEAYILAVERL